MREKLQFNLIFVVISVLSIIAISQLIGSINAINPQQSFSAKLSGINEVPPVSTSASGTAQFKLSPDNKTMSYTISANNINSVTESHIHQGKTGQNGPSIVQLTIADSKMDYGCQCMLPAIGDGKLTSDNLKGPMAGKQISDLITLIKNGQAYVNIHTQKNTNGEIRGQILQATK